MNRGYIKLYRKIIDSEVFADPILLKLFLLCLLKANHKTVYVTIVGVNRPIKVEPGQFVSGRYELYKQFYPSQTRVNRKFAPLTLWRKLKVLQGMSILNIKSYSKYSIITVLNWPQYQSNEQQLNNRRTTAEHQLNTNKNDKNDKKTLAIDLYTFYLKEISPKSKSRQRAISNITSHLKNYQYKDLISTIKNYKSVCLERDPQYRKDPANFFGKHEQYFKDFRPSEFKPMENNKRKIIRAGDKSIIE